MFGMSDLSSLTDDAPVAEARDVDRCRERDVVAAAVLAELGVGDLDVVEQLVLDLDRVLLLERRDDVLADVVEPVVDDQLRLGDGTGVGAGVGVALGGLTWR